MSGPLLACRLPDGRKVAIDTAAADRLSCGVVVLDPVTVCDNPAVAEATASLGADLATIFAGRKPSEIPGLKEARNLYKSFGSDPSRHRPSSEALLRRVLKGLELYRISNVVDACNLSSLSFLLPVGMYDLDLVQGDIALRVGREGEQYPGIRKGDVHLAGRLGLFDSQGPFGSPTSDSARTCTSPATLRILAVIMATAAFSADRMDENISTFSHNFARFCGGIETYRAVLGRGS
jgi:DNA/RNA-binding domain of Phe-tRNA-synthetase-like protein